MSPHEANARSAEDTGYYEHEAHPPPPRQCLLGVAEMQRRRSSGFTFSWNRGSSWDWLAIGFRDTQKPVALFCRKRAGPARPSHWEKTREKNVLITGKQYYGTGAITVPLSPS